jgi:hypothetical protein
VEGVRITVDKISLNGNNKERLGGTAGNERKRARPDGPPNPNMGSMRGNRGNYGGGRFTGGRDGDGRYFQRQ